MLHFCQHVVQEAGAIIISLGIEMTIVCLVRLVHRPAQPHKLRAQPRFLRGTAVPPPHGRRGAHSLDSNPSKDFTASVFFCFVNLKFRNAWCSKVLATQLSVPKVWSGWLRAYAQCNRDGPGVVLLLINVDTDTTFHVHAESAPSWLHLLPRSEFVLSAKALDARVVELNGKALLVSDAGQLPELAAAAGTTPSISIAPRTIAFFELRAARAKLCS